MGVAAKGKRRVLVGGKTYYWYAAETEKWREPYVFIVAEDKSLIASCPLYCPSLRIQTAGKESIAVPFEIKVFTNEVVRKLVLLALGEA